MDALTINEAAETTGRSPRMLRYIERIGLVETARSASRYRLYGPEQLQRLRTLRELLASFDVGLGEVGFALRMRSEPALAGAVDAWVGDETHKPEGDAADADWLRWEQEKHQRLLELVTNTEKTAA